MYHFNGYVTWIEGKVVQGKKSTIERKVGFRAKQMQQIGDETGLKGVAYDDGTKKYEEIPEVFSVDKDLFDLIVGNKEDELIIGYKKVKNDNKIVCVKIVL